MKKTKKKHVIEAWVWKSDRLSQLFHFSRKRGGFAKLIADQYIYKAPYNPRSDGKRIRITIEEV